MCGGPAWKREIVPDHKFDFVDTREFTDNSFGMRMKYLWLYILVLKSFLVYVSDIFTAVTMLTTKSWSNQIFENCKEVKGCVAIPFNVGKWLFVGCIIFSFLLLAYEARKSKKIIASRDISYAFTNVMANNYYSLRSYDHFCFFANISQSAKKSDDFAFFIFFTFKSWKRVFFADGPRQFINGLTLFAIYLSKKGNPGSWYDLPKYFQGNTLITTGLTISTMFTVLIFAGSLILLVIAGLCYIPLLCYIKGNLKEYCCHKVDKRISEIIKRRNKERLAKAAALMKKEAAGDYSHLKNKKGELAHQPLPQPTLPNISLDDDDLPSIRRGPSPSNLSDAKSNYTTSESRVGGLDYPAMPAYNQPYSQHQDPNGYYAQYNPSAPSLPDEQQQYYQDDYGSTAHLVLEPSEQAYGDSYGTGYVADPYDVYSGYAGNGQQTNTLEAQGTYHHPTRSNENVGLAYDEPSQDYPPQDYPQRHPPQYGHRTPSPGYGGGYGPSGGHGQSRAV